MAARYDEFIANKLVSMPPDGIENAVINTAQMFPFQRDLTQWALRRGRCAIFADTGLGKMRMELFWAARVWSYTGKPVLILAPLAVAAQIKREAELIGVDAVVCRDGKDVQDSVNVTNYERLHRFDSTRFGGVVLDESSCIKHFESKTLSVLLDAFGGTPFKLCASATPAPNDYTELGTHSEFLGICRRQEMLSEFFCHDGGETQTWRLKGHARPAFWRWVASWGALVRLPSDLGYEDADYLLPPLAVEKHTTRSVAPKGYLFPVEAATLAEQRAVRKASLGDRVAACAALVNADNDPHWVIWCDLNTESKALTESIHGAIEITGSMDLDEKERRLLLFGEGKVRALVSKASICGHGLNWQHCARMAFVGVTHSYESYYQAIRRCWRFGQRRPVQIHIFASESEGAVVANLERKGEDAKKMADELSTETRDMVRAEVCGSSRESNEYAPTKVIMLPGWLTTQTQSMEPVH